jgi:anti-sigma regulatory factor (Ser/Thr protein kinase)
VAPDGGASVIEARTTLEAEPASARAARQFVRDRLHEWHCEHVAEAVVLLISELVTNAIVHAGTSVALTVQCAEDAIRVEIDDHSTELPVPRRVAPDPISGHGLKLVDVMSGRWGVEQQPGGKTVWFEVPV